MPIITRCDLDVYDEGALWVIAKLKGDFAGA